MSHPPRTGGVYVISDEERHLYVGRSRNLRNRFDTHRSLNSPTQSAGFAFLLAREASGHLRPTYAQGEGSRRWLETDAEFMEAFAQAKRRVRDMQFRFVEDNDPIRQTTLEVYCAVVLGTPYNKFETT